MYSRHETHSNFRVLQKQIAYQPIRLNTNLGKVIEVKDKETVDRDLQPWEVDEDIHQIVSFKIRK